MKIIFFHLILLNFVLSQEGSNEEEVPVCGGFIEFDAEKNILLELKKNIDYSAINVQYFTTDMILKDQTNLAASGYYFLPIYDNESFILKISGPHGMSFEPEQYIFNVEQDRGIKEICQNDINFKFRGFIVEGQVSTFGSNDGPEGIKLELYNSLNEKVQLTNTFEKGLFKFKPVNPGSYTIKPQDDKQMFDPNHSEFKFTININSSNFFERALIIKGYNVFGRIEADNEPLADIYTFIYSYNSTLTKNYNCDYGKVANFKEFTFNGMAPFCAISTKDDGLFSFTNIPYGKFLIKPIYKDKYVFYELEPETISINVEHHDYRIEQPFQAVHFSIYGRVINGKKNGIPNVVIKIDGQEKAITDQNGIYKLEKLSPGNYDLEAQADDMFFDPLTNIRITAHLKVLPDLIVTDYKLCGVISIEATDYFSTSKRTVVLQDANDKTSKKERRTITDNKGKYCFEVKPGLYHIYPVLTQEEKDLDLHLQPEFYDLEVIDRPLMDVNFYQSKVIVSGKIICKDQCDKDIQVKLVASRTDRMLTTGISEKGEFEFKDILSGQYKLFIIKPNWCWEEEDLVVKVQNTDIHNIRFVQTGYSLFYSSNHNIEIEWENVETKIRQKTLLDKSKTKTCLPNKGTYKIVPKSCHKFKETAYLYKTDKSNKLELVPIEFLSKGSIELDDVVISEVKKFNITDIKVNLKIEELNVSGERTPYKTLTLDTKQNTTLYAFFTKPNTELIVTPLIHSDMVSKNFYKNLLFLPKEKRLSIKENCQEDISLLTFKMKSGLIIEGKVSPPMNSVLISAYNKENNELVTSTNTNDNGLYKIGPLYTETQYEIKAFKDGYKIVLEKDSYNFNAEKLSFLRVKIIDNNKKPLSSVFLSLSSADRGFKINNNTNQDGYYDFVELYSGEYYIKPLFKEYKFEPSQKLVKVLGGQHYEETLIAHRIAFSIFGKINNLNREKVEGLYIQAYDEKTKQLQETAIDKNGEYRLKGLIPGHKYVIKVKIPINSSIEKALPASIPITLGEDDVTGIDFVVLQRSKQIDIRGYLNYTEDDENCPFDKVQRAYVELIKADDDDDIQPVTKNVNNACQFIYRNLEKVKYIMKVFEKQGKTSPYPKLIQEINFDLSDEREISGGVKIINVNMETIKKSVLDTSNYNIYSPIFLFVLVIALLKLDYTLKIVDVLIIAPLRYLKRIKKKKYGKNN